MSPKNDAKLVQQYPKIFADRFKDQRKTAMCWGFSCGDGWYEIIDALCVSIQNYIDDNQHKDIDQVIASQVKEKFGTLRFYYTGGDTLIDGMAWLAEEFSSRTCEECGRPGKTYDGGWVRTLCDHHAKEFYYD